MEEGKQSHLIWELFLEGNPLAIAVEFELEIKKSYGGGCQGDSVVTYDIIDAPPDVKQLREGNQRLQWQFQ